MIISHGYDCGEHAIVTCHDFDDTRDFDYYTVGENFDQVVTFIADQLPE